MANGKQKFPEREFETGKDESWFANVKRTYDEYQEVSLNEIRKNKRYIEKVLSDAQQNDNWRQGIANLALANAVFSSNLCNLKALGHGDLAVDRQWNVDEVSTLTAKSGVQADAFIVLLAEKVAAVLNKKNN